MSANIMTNALPQPESFAAKLAACLLPRQQQHISYWTLEQLHVRPYQHLLEIGYGTGRTLEQVARRLKVGFLAGIDHSMSMYRQAYRKNRSYIQQQLLQLHLGNLFELPYPSQYFHTIYGTNAHLQWQDPQLEFMRLSNLLKSGGKLIMVFQPAPASTNADIRHVTEKIQLDYEAAGLTDIRIRYRDTDPVTCIAVSGQRV